MSAFDSFKQEFGVASKDEMALAKLARNWTLDQLEGLADEWGNNPGDPFSPRYLVSAYYVNELLARIKELREE